MVVGRLPAPATCDDMCIASKSDARLVARDYTHSAQIVSDWWRIACIRAATLVMMMSRCSQCCRARGRERELALNVPILWRIIAVAILVAGCHLPDATWAKTLRGSALVIGQSDYRHLSPLVNPVNDAQAISGLLRQLGFSVSIAENRNSSELIEDIGQFGEGAKGSDVVLVYYSGHGFEAGGQNFLTATDVDPASLEAGSGAYPLSGLLETLRKNSKVVILLLDACRTNPFPADTTIKTGDAPNGEIVGDAGLGVPRGAALLASSDGADSLGEVIGFAAEPGRVALDGEAGGYSPFAAALIKHFSAGERRFSDIMTMVTEEVYLKTRTRQRPWTNASLRRVLYFGGAGESADPDDAALRDARRDLLMTIAAAPDITRTYVERLADRDGLPLDALYGMLAELDVDTSAGPAGIAQQLRAGAEKLKAFMAERITPVRTDAELARLSDLALRAEQEGAIGLAKKYRAQASARADELSGVLDMREGELSSDRLELASVYAEHARTAVLTFDHEMAAARYRAAYEQAENWDRALAFRYKLGEADALTELGSLSGNQEVLRDAVDVYQDALDLVPRRKSPLDWAEAKNNMAGAYWSLGRREEGLDSFEIALEAYREALKARPRKQVPVLWAKTQNNIGNVLAEMGLRLEGKKHLSDAVKAYREALKVFSPDNQPYYYGVAQSNTGNALLNIGMRENGTRNLYRAIEVLKIALDHQKPADEPFSWSAAQRNLGNAYFVLGERKGDAAIMRQAIEAYHATLQVQTRDRMPAEWAATQINLGNALKHMGKLTEEGRYFEEASVAYEAALTQWTFEKSPRDWGVAMIELGGAKLETGRLRGDRELIVAGKLLVEEARDAFLEAGLDQYRNFFASELEPFDKALDAL